MPDALDMDEVRVRWWLTADVDARALAAAADLLSPPERERWGRFVRDRDRRDFAAAHALLRRELSACAGGAPSSWTFAAAPGGKPTLAPEFAPAGLSFSLAHTDGFVACAVAREASVGVDVERLDRAADALAIARRYFSAREIADLERRPDPSRRERFIEIWTLKEAYVKATGDGLSQPLSAFAFAVDADRRVSFDPPARDSDASAWQFALVAPTPRHRLAVAVAATPSRRWRISVEPAEPPPAPIRRTRSS